jgi:glutathionylspermidine synthase
MRREYVAPRPDWRERLAAIDYHIAFHPDGAPYWCEDHCYVLRDAEVEMFHEAAEAAHGMIMTALERAFATGGLSALGLPDSIQRLAADSWAAGEPSLYGRMDFAWDGVKAPILLEYNADTPTALYEAAVVQWRWLADRDPSADQYNLVQEKLIARWPACAAHSGVTHFAYLRDVDEEMLTAEYLRECAQAAGVATESVGVEEIGWTGARFVDRKGDPIDVLFKLYPTEWMAQEAFAAHLDVGRPRLIEPPWRLAASSKALLAELWRMFPKAENLAPAMLVRPNAMSEFVVKPVFGREGAGVRFGDRPPLHESHRSEERVVYQQRVRAKRFDGQTPVFGVWLIGGEPCGLGVREDDAEITGPRARFVPHRIE